MSIKRAGSILTVAALTASTALSAPTAAFAQATSPVRMAQAEPSPLDAPPEAIAPVEPEAAAPEQDPAPEPEAPAAPAVEEPAEIPPPEPELPPEVEAPPVEAAAPETPAAEASAPDAQPTDEPAQADDGISQQPVPDFEQPPQPQAASEPEAAPDFAPADPVSPAVAPEEPVVAPNPVPAPPAPAPEVQPAPAPSVDPAPSAPAQPAPSAPVGEAVPAPVPGQPAPPATPPAGADPFTPPPVEGMPAPPVEATAPVAAPPAEAPRPVSAQIQNAPVDPAAISRTDARVQNLAAPVEVAPVRQERGERVPEVPKPELPPRAQVVKRVGDRDILAIVGAAAAGAAVGAAAGYFIRPDDETRLSAGSRERYEERLPRGRTRETIMRPDGTQVVTVRDRYGDIVRRSRIMPDDREVVLFYDPYDGRDEDGRGYVFDPGAELPPLRVQIPRERYVVDVSEPDEDLYYETIVAPPVETVERIYSVDEVRRSARIRDKVRRIDLNTINFDFGKATISQSEVANLEALATAVSKVIRSNPGETFLIEGHTDAVGSDVANLALSDRRAEAVAEALTNFFGVPPENLVTQGYGEGQLKVATQGENRENRRVTLRRITALVKPVG